MSKFQQLDLTDHKGAVYVVGDIHGCWSKLEKKLDEIGFNKDKDILLSVGDLVDRGPESDRFLEYVDAPWFHAIAGNHEDLMIEYKGRDLHKINGGKWFSKIAYSTRFAGDLPARILQRARQLPTIMEVLLRDGRKIGLVHAAYPITKSWDDAEMVANRYTEACMWDRQPLKEAKSAATLGYQHSIEGVDHVYYGHTPMDNVFRSGNQSWIDTGGWHDSGYFTVEKIIDRDPWAGQLFNADGSISEEGGKYYR